MGVINMAGIVWYYQNANTARRIGRTTSRHLVVGLVVPSANRSRCRLLDNTAARRHSRCLSVSHAAVAHRTETNEDTLFDLLRPTPSGPE